MLLQTLRSKLGRHALGSSYRNIWQVLHLDPWLLLGLGLIIIMGLLTLYSAHPQDLSLIKSQLAHLLIAVIIMALLAQVHPVRLKEYAVPLYGITLFLLVAVLVMGHMGKGAERWLSLGPISFQPSELTQIVIPLTLAWYYEKINLPPNMKILFLSCLVILIPCLLIAKEPDLGTAVVTAIAGFTIILLAGLRWRWLALMTSGLVLLLPIVYKHMHGYQKERVKIFFNPQSDPQGAGYHIIQSQISIGSGQFWGQGFLHASQSQLGFLPENTTDFIFSVFAQQFGLFGSFCLIVLYLLVSWRGLTIALKAPDTFTRLLAGSLSLAFFMSFFVNLGMVSGIIPVVGVPLPLISYGGTSMIAFMAGFGVLMAIEMHPKLISS
jgi:rod shape determining protein RodA